MEYTCADYEGEREIERGLEGEISLPGLVNVA
jgi:hypothetical protein